MLPSLPSAVITDEILIRLPLESLMKFKEGCQEWNKLLSESDYMYKHLDFVKKHFMGIDDRVRVINPMEGVVKSSQIPQSFELGTYINSLIHCDGMFLCQYNNRRVMGLKLALWNPLMNQVQWITPRILFGLTDCYGIRYHCHKRSDY